MRVPFLALTLSITALCNGRGLLARAEELDLLEVVASAGSSPQHFVVTRAAFGGVLPRVADGTTPFRLVQATITADCQRIEFLSQSHSSVLASAAVLMERGGNCSFVQKALAVQTAGASLLIVGDSVEGAYASSRQTGRPIFDCSVGSATVSRNVTNAARYPHVDEQDLLDDDDAALTSCQARTSCATNTCVYTGAASSHSRTEVTDTRFQVCCFANTLVRMGVDAQSAALASRVTIPAVFTCYRDTLQLQRLLRRAAVSATASKSDNRAAASASSSVLTLRAFNAEENPWNVSMLITWLLGVGIVVGAAYRSAADERHFSYEKVAMGLAPLSSDTGTLETQYISIGDDQAPSLAVPHARHDMEDDDGDGNNERVELSTRHALYFVVGSSSILVLLYYGHLALLMNVLFLVATTASMTQVVVLPVLASVLCAGSRASPALDENSKTTTRERLLWIASISVAATLSIYWFVNRASASIWPLQDLLCISLCIVVIDSIQMPSLKVATALLGTAFLYDIFFVYVSPLVFGSSVMVDVASGNGGIQAAAATTGSAGNHEKLPMVLTVPLLFSYYGGNALLGLGDLILPGLLVSLCIRFDYCRGYPLSRSYFMVASVSYALGLLLANVMAIALRDVVAGQPALMYIVPLTLGSVTALAISRHELAELWHGPPCLRMDHHYATAHNVRRDEVEPFLKKQ